MLERKYFRKLFCLGLAFCVVGSMLTFGCTEPVEPSPKTLQIGAILPLTGMASMLGEGARDGIIACAAWLNEEGGITINGQDYEIELLIEDSKGNPPDAIAAANKLIYSDEVKFILGATIPFVSMAIASVTEEAGVLRCSVGGAGTPSEVNPSLPLTFASWSGIQTIPTVYDYLVDTYPTVETVAISYQEDPSCGYIAGVLQQVAEERELQVVFSESYPFETVDFYPLLTGMLATNPDAIDLGCTAPPSAVAIFNQARELGFTGPIVYTGQGIANLIVAMVGEDMATDFIGTDPDFTSPELPSITKEIQDYMTDNYGKELNMDICLGWSVLWYVTQAIEAAQSLEPSEVVATWEEMESIESVFGTAKMGGLETYGINHVVCQPRVILRIQNGEMETVEWLVPEIP